MTLSSSASVEFQFSIASIVLSKHRNKLNENLLKV